jgi:hypothetical protein
VKRIIGGVTGHGVAFLAMEVGKIMHDRYLKVDKWQKQAVNPTFDKYMSGHG